MNHSRSRPRRLAAGLAGGLLLLLPLTPLPAAEPDDPAAATYLDNRWLMPHPSPLAGDAFNSYNDGPTEPGAESLGGFYELETLSPTQPLATGESLRHSHSTVHITGPLEKLAAIARLTLRVELDDVRLALDQ